MQKNKDHMLKKYFSVNTHDIEDNPSNYDICDFIATKFRQFPWDGSTSALSKKVIEFIDSFGEMKSSIAALSIYVLYDVLNVTELIDELPLDTIQIMKFRPIVRDIIITDIVNYIEPKIDLNNLIQTHLQK